MEMGLQEERVNCGVSVPSAPIIHHSASSLIHISIMYFLRKVTFLRVFRLQTDIQATEWLKSIIVSPTLTMYM